MDSDKKIVNGFPFWTWALSIFPKGASKTAGSNYLKIGPPEN